MNRTFKEATVKPYHYDNHEQLRTHLDNFMAAYNYARRLKTLSGLNTYEYICKKKSWFVPTLVPRGTALQRASRAQGQLPVGRLPLRIFPTTSALPKSVLAELPAGWQAYSVFCPDKAIDRPTGLLN